MQSSFSQHQLHTFDMNNCTICLLETCQESQFGSWLDEDHQECLEETISQLNLFSTSLEMLALPSTQSAISKLSESMKVALSDATTLLRELPPIDHHDVVNFAVEHQRRRSIVLMGVRIASVVTSNILASNITMNNSSIHNVLNSLNQLSLTSGVDVLSVNLTDVLSQFNGTSLSLPQSSPFHYVNAMMGLVHGIGRRTKQPFESTSEEAGIDIAVAELFQSSSTQISSDPSAGKPFSVTIPTNFMDSDRDIVTMVYFDPSRSGQQLPATQNRLASAIVDLVVLSNHSSNTSTSSKFDSMQHDDALITKVSSFQMTFDISLPSTITLRSLLQQYLDDTALFLEHVTPTIVGIAFASSDPSSIVLKLRLPIHMTSTIDREADENLQHYNNYSIDDSLWKSIAASIQVQCTDTVQGPLCYDPMDLTIQVPFTPSCRWWDNTAVMWACDGCQLSQVFLVASQHNQMSSQNDVQQAGIGETNSNNSWIPFPFINTDNGTSSFQMHLRAICECTHMTTFAVLVTNSPNSVAKPLRIEQQILAVVTYVGTIISVVCLLLTVVAYAILWKKPFVQQHHRMVVHMCVPLMTSQLLLLLVLHPDTKTHGGWCLFVSGLLHFCLISICGWILCIARDIFGTFVTVFTRSTGSCNLRTMVISVYGSAGAIIAVSMGFAHNLYRTDDICWINMSSPLRLAFLVPFGVTLIISTVILTRVLANIKNRVQLKTTAFAGLTFLWILGFSWLFGIIVMLHHHVVWEYLFTLFTLGEGIFIFVHYCVRSIHVREAFLVSEKSRLTRRQETMLNAKEKDYSSNKLHTASTSWGDDSMTTDEDLLCNRSRTKSSKQKKQTLSKLVPPLPKQLPQWITTRSSRVEPIMTEVDISVSNQESFISQASVVLNEESSVEENSNI